MGKAHTVEIDRTDLTTLLSSLAADLRNAGSAIRGMGYEVTEPGEQGFEDHDRLAASMDRVAAILGGIHGHLCPACGLQEIREQVQFGSLLGRRKRAVSGKTRARGKGRREAGLQEGR